jgi:hypothetical protein
MTNRTSEQAFADAASGMVHADPIGDILSRLVKDCVEVVGAEAAAILVQDADEQLELLASSSAAATHLELLQAQDVQGPCVDVIRTGEPQSAAGAAEMARRWGDVGDAIVEAGFGFVGAFPLNWRGRVLGGLNVFGGEGTQRDASIDAVCQAFADVATIVLVHSSEIPADELTMRVHQATVARDLIEQAKGVLSELHVSDMEQAMARLEEVAKLERVSLPDAAQRVIARASASRTS